PLHFPLKSLGSTPLNISGILLTEMSDMAATPYAAKSAAYSSAQAHGGVAAADPHRLIVMLLDSALERISTARGCMTRGEKSEEARLLYRAGFIIDELRTR